MNTQIAVDDELLARLVANRLRQMADAATFPGADVKVVRRLRRSASRLDGKAHNTPVIDNLWPAERKLHLANLEGDQALSLFVQVSTGELPLGKGHNHAEETLRNAGIPSSRLAEATLTLLKWKLAAELRAIKAASMLPRSKRSTEEMLSSPELSERVDAPHRSPLEIWGRGNPARLQAIVEAHVVELIRTGSPQMDKRHRAKLAKRMAFTIDASKLAKEAAGINRALTGVAASGERSTAVFESTLTESLHKAIQCLVDRRLLQRLDREQRAYSRTLTPAARVWRSAQNLQRPSTSDLHALASTRTGQVALTALAAGALAGGIGFANYAAAQPGPHSELTTEVNDLWDQFYADCKEQFLLAYADVRADASGAHAGMTDESAGTWTPPARSYALEL